MTTSSIRILAVTERIQRQTVHRESGALARLRREMHRVRSEHGAEARSFERVCSALRRPRIEQDARCPLTEQARRKLAHEELSLRAATIQTQSDRESALAATSSLHLGALAAAHATADRCAALAFGLKRERAAVAEELNEAEREEDRLGIWAAVDNDQPAAAGSDFAIGRGECAPWGDSPRPGDGARERSEERQRHAGERSAQHEERSSDRSIAPAESDAERERHERRRHGEDPRGAAQLRVQGGDTMDIEVQLEGGGEVSVSVRAHERPDIVSVEMSHHDPAARPLLIEERAEIARRLEVEGITLRELVLRRRAASGEPL